jgi:hypothetical protein
MFFGLKRLVFASACAVWAVGCLASGPAAAASPKQHFVSIKSGHAGAGPAVDLKGSGSTVVYDPRRVDGVEIPSGQCSSSNYSFAIFNDTSKGQKVTYAGKVEFRVAAGKGIGVCAGGTGKAVFGLVSSPAAKLKIDIT